MTTMFFINILLLAGYIDYKQRIIPNWCITVILVVNLFQSSPIRERLLSFVVVGLLFLIPAVITDGIGGGDVKLIAVSSLYATLPYSLYVSVFALLFCTITGYLLKQKSLAFAPFLALSYIIFIII